MSQLAANYAKHGQHLYGDIDNVRKDSALIREILDRQGTDLILEVIANQIGEKVSEFNMNQGAINNIVNSISNSLKELVSERT